MVSFDVTSLFTNVPVGTTVDWLREFLNKKKEMM
jgi:hypothetical protein